MADFPELAEQCRAAGVDTAARDLDELEIPEVAVSPEAWHRQRHEALLAG